MKGKPESKKEDERVNKKLNRTLLLTCIKKVTQMKQSQKYWKWMWKQS